MCHRSNKPVEVNSQGLLAYASLLLFEYENFSAVYDNLIKVAELERWNCV